MINGHDESQDDDESQSSTNNKIAKVEPMVTKNGYSHAYFLSLFNCPNCLSFIGTPILQCEQGHLICKECQEQYNECPTCDCPLGYIRNITMETVASKIFFQCKYSLFGCTASLLGTEKIKHEMECEYHTLNCPSMDPSCKWNGILSLLMDHLKDDHKSISILEAENATFLATNISVPGIVHWHMIQFCFGQYFMLILSKLVNNNEPEKYIAYVQFLGLNDLCKNFTYKLELNSQKRHLSWKSTPCSLFKQKLNPILNYDHLKFDKETALRFSVNNNLEINVTISTTIKK